MPTPPQAYFSSTLEVDATGDGVDCGSPPYGYWHSSEAVSRSQARLVTFPLSLIYSPSVDFYQFTTKITSLFTNNVYDPQGDTAAVGDHLWGKFDNESIFGPDGSCWSILSGSLDLCTMNAPDLGAPDTAPFGPLEGIRGYQTTNQCAVARYTINDDWACWPLANNDDKQGWDCLIKLWWAVQKRMAVLGAGVPIINPANGSSSSSVAYEIYWPPPNVSWFNGTVEDITDNLDGTYDVNCGSVTWDNLCAGASLRWVDYVCTACGLGYIPSTYDVVIVGDDHDPFTTVRGTITAQTYSGPGPATGIVTITGLTIDNAITANYIPNLSYLVGKPFYFLKTGGLWISDRIPDKPNDNELWLGTLSSGCIDGSNNGFLQQSDNDYAVRWMYDETAKPVGWAINQWATAGSSSSSSSGYECMVFDTDGLLHRLPIVGNNANTLYFGTYGSSSSSSSSSSSCSIFFTGVFAIIKAGLKCDPSKVPWAIGRWYGGYTLDWKTHLPDDTQGTVPMESVTASWNEGDPCEDVDCEPVPHTANDTDVQIELTNSCEPSRAGDYLAPDYYKSIRALQIAILGICTNFVPPDDFTGQSYIPKYCPATLLNDCSINSWSSTLSYDEGDSSWSVSLPSFDISPYPRTVYYKVLKDDGNGDDTSDCGTCTIDADGILSATFTPPASSSSSSGDVGDAIILSVGFSRFYPREVNHMFYERKGFLPDVGLDGPIFPPSVSFGMGGTTDCVGKGVWIKRDISTHYITTDDFGFTGEGTIAFAEGEYARYIGDSAFDPAYGGFTPTTSTDDLATYKDKFYQGHLNEVNTNARIAAMVGTSTGGSSYYVEDTTKDFWSLWPSSGVQRTELGTATGGSTTTLLDSTKDTTDNTHESICWWAASRWLTGDPFVGMILEVTKASGSSSSSGSPTIYYLPITGTSNGAGGVTFTFAAVSGLTVAAGDTYQVREVNGEWDTFAGRTLNLSDTMGNNYEVTITHNDDKRIYFSALDEYGTSAGAGWKYQVVEKQYGTVWKWDGSKWVVPGPTDAIRTAVDTPEDFKADQTLNLPTVVKDYGNQHKGDYFARTTLNELQCCIEKLYCVLLSAGWNLATYWTSSGGTIAIDGTSETVTTYPSGATSGQYPWTITDDGSGVAVWPMTMGVNYDGRQQINSEGDLRAVSGTGGNPTLAGFCDAAIFDGTVHLPTDPDYFHYYIMDIFGVDIGSSTTYSTSIGSWNITDINTRTASGGNDVAGNCMFQYPDQYDTTITCLQTAMCNWAWYDCGATSCGIGD